MAPAAPEFWRRVSAPLAEKVYGLIRDQAAKGAADEPYILEETVEGVGEDGRYRIGGVWLTTKGTAKLRVGQRVHVFWRNGRRERILTHHWRRAQGGGGELLVYAVEELLLYEAATDQPAGKRWDVYFRNDAQVTRLNLHETINADRQTTWNFIEFGFNATGVFRIGWGEADNTFWVMALAHDGVDAASSRWWARFYTFRLSRAEGEPAGGATQTATLMATVDLPVFTMPAKYSALNYVAESAIATPVEFPYLPLAETRTAQIVLERSGKIVMFAAHTLQNAYSVGLSPASFIEEVTYLFAVRSGTESIIWESTITDAYRASPPPAAPDFPNLPDDFTVNPAFLVRLYGFAVMEWHATEVTKRRVLTSWDVLKATVGTSFGADPTPSGATLDYAKRGVFVEDGAPPVTPGTPAVAVQPWTDYQFDPEVIGGGTFVETTPTRIPAIPAATDRVLLHGTRLSNLTGPIHETRLELWNGALTTLALRESALDGVLQQRANALRLFPGRTVYVLAEDSPFAATGAWPAVAERGRFTLLSGELPLDVGKALANDGTHAGPVAALPAGLADIDPNGTVGFLEPFRLAYHVAGTIE